MELNSSCGKGLPHSETGLGLIPDWDVRGPFCEEFACFPCVCLCFLRVVWFPPIVQRHAVRIIVDGKWPLGGYGFHSIQDAAHEHTIPDQTEHSGVETALISGKLQN